MNSQLYWDSVGDCYGDSGLSSTSLKHLWIKYGANSGISQKIFNNCFVYCRQYPNIATARELLDGIATISWNYFDIY